MKTTNCEFAGDTYVNGWGWFTSVGQVFMLSLAREMDCVMVVDADLADDNIVNRWAGSRPSLPIQWP